MFLTVAISRLCIKCISCSTRGPSLLNIKITLFLDCNPKNVNTTYRAYIWTDSVITSLGWQAVVIINWAFINVYTYKTHRLIYFYNKLNIIEQCIYILNPSSVWISRSEHIHRFIYKHMYVYTEIFHTVFILNVHPPTHSFCVTSKLYPGRQLQ